MSFFAARRTQERPPIDAPAVMIATASGQVRYADPAILGRPDLVSADGALVDDQLLNTLRWVDQGFVGEGSRFLSAASAGPDSQAVHVLSTPLRRHYAVSIGHLDREACIAGLRRGLLDAAAVDRAKADRGFPSWVELGELVQRLAPAPAAGELCRALRDQMAEALKQSPSIVLDGDAFWHDWLLAELLLTESVRHRRFGPPRLRFEAHAHSLFLTISDDRPDDAFGHAAGEPPALIESLPGPAVEAGCLRLGYPTMADLADALGGWLSSARTANGALSTILSLPLSALNIVRPATHSGMARSAIA